MKRTIENRKVKGTLVNTVEVPRNDGADLLPTSYVPTSRNRFLFQMEGIDSYVVLSVKVPQIRYAQNKLVPDGRLELRIHDSDDENGAAKILNILTGGSKKPATLKLLSQVGMVLKSFRMNLTPYNVNFGEYNYNSSSFVDILIQFDVDSIALV
jgi:hypothetical protein